MQSVTDILSALEGHQDCDFRPAAGLPSVPDPLLLPGDVAAFYAKWSEARLFGPDDPRYHLLPPAEFVQVGLAVYGERSPDPIQQSWFAFAHVRDGNYMAVDCGPDRLGWVYDVFHETANDPSYCKVVAHSFSEFLATAVACGDNAWWLQDGATDYGYADGSRHGNPGAG